MFQEPKVLPWLAKKAGVPFPEAREIWRDVASEADARSACARLSAAGFTCMATRG